jgi:tripartite ATP-independent transporter DctP family solute receptor
MAVFGLPYLFRDEQHYWRVLNGPIGRELLATGEAHGIHGLCYYDSGSRSFYTIKKPILTPGDVKELKLRVLPSKTARDMVLTLGGGPTPVPWGELYTALQQGMVDGAENNPPSFLSSRHYEIAKQFSLDEHTRIPDMVIFSKPIWDRLSPEERNWVNQAAAESVDFQRKLWKEKTEEALAIVAEAGVTIHRPDKAPFVAATGPMYAALTDERITRLVRRIRDVP